MSNEFMLQIQVFSKLISTGGVHSILSIYMKVFPGITACVKTLISKAYGNIPGDCTDSVYLACKIFNKIQAAAGSFNISKKKIACKMLGQVLSC